MSTVTVVTASTFDKEVHKSKIPVVIDFWAPWCGPCKAMAPVFKKMAETYAGKVKFVKVDIDDNEELAKQFRITAVPTLVFVSGGKRIASVAGACNQREMILAIQKHFDISVNAR